MKVHIKALARSTTMTIWLITLLTIWSELSQSFKTLLTGIVGHHWVTKGVLSLIVFIIAYIVFSNIYKEKIDVKKETYYTLATGVFGGLIIFIFYVWHFLS